MHTLKTIVIKSNLESIKWLLKNPMKEVDFLRLANPKPISI